MDKLLIHQVIFGIFYGKTNISYFLFSLCAASFFASKRLYFVASWCGPLLPTFSGNWFGFTQQNCIKGDSLILNMKSISTLTSSVCPVYWFEDVLLC